MKKCLYCDFYSITDKSLITAYTDALIEETKSHKDEKTQTVYVGGGTPTSIGGELLRIVDAVNETFIFEDDYEFTVEANPGAVDEKLLKSLFEKGVNRVSLGVQSFNDDELKALGRIHNSDDALKSIDMIKGAGFTNFSIDLMFAIPGQTIESLLYSLDCIKKINPPHVSVYSLILEEGTPFYDMELQLPDEDTEVLPVPTSIAKGDMKYQTMQRRDLKADTIQATGVTASISVLVRVHIPTKIISGMKMLLMYAFI